MSITDPTGITSCILWLDADLGVTLTSGRVSTWADQSGLGNNFTQSTASNRPTRITGDNSRSAIRFGGASEYLVGPNLFGSATAGEILIVVRTDMDVEPNDPMTGLWNFGNAGSNTHFPYTDGTIYDDWGSNSRKTTVNPTPDLSTAFRRYNVSSASGNWTSRLDGTQIFTTASNTVAFTTTPSIGKSTGSFFLHGQIVGVYAFSSVLTSTERSDLHAYLDTLTTPTSITPVGTAPSHGAELVCWLKADAGVTLTSARISAWGDQSGTGNNAAQATAINRPIVTKCSLNGRDAVRFMGEVNSYITLGNILASVSACEFMAILAFRVDPPPSGGAPWSFGGPGVTGVLFDNTGGVLENAGASTRFSFTHAGQSLETPRFYNVWSASNDWAAILDTTTLHTESTNTVGVNTAPDIGRSGGNVMDGWFGEFLAFSRKLTASERGQWRDYLSDRWGLGLTPSGYTGGGSSGPVFRIAGFIG